MRDWLRENIWTKKKWGKKHSNTWTDTMNRMKFDPHTAYGIMSIFDQHVSHLEFVHSTLGC